MSKTALGPADYKAILAAFGFDMENRFITEATVTFKPGEAVTINLTEVLFKEDQIPLPKETIYHIVKEPSSDS